MKDWSKFCDITYVINLKSRTDRWESITQFAQDAELPITQFKAFEAAKVDMEKHRYGIRTKKPSCIACSLSHINLYREALKKGYKQVMVLEDDAMLPADLHKQLTGIFSRNKKILKDFDMFYLGAANKYPPAVLNEDIAISQYTLLTHAYIVSEAGMKKMVDFVDTRYDGKIPASIDVFLAEDLQPLLKVYQLNNFIVKTISSYSDLAFCKRNWDSVTIDCLKQGQKNPKKWNSFVDKAAELTDYPQTLTKIHKP